MGALRQVAGSEPRPFISQDFGRAGESWGWSALVPRDDAFRKMAELTTAVPSGHFAFLGTDRFLGGGPETKNAQELCVIASSDQFDALRAVATDGINMGFETEGIIEKLKEWDARYGIDIAQASSDTVTFRWLRQPTDGPALAKEIEAFCPDIIWQGVGSVEAMADIVSSSPTMQLWWD